MESDSRDAVDAIKTRLDITEVARDYIPDIRRAGRHFKARCPFHNERTPSFILNPERQTFHCFGCGEGGDVFTLVMKIENLTFPEALEKLGERAGVRVVKRRAHSEADQERLKAREALAFAKDLYHAQLLSASGAQARRYLKKRGITEAVARSFGLGFAANGGGLVAAARKKGFAPELLARIGLAAPKKAGGGFRDYFFNRVIFPIIDTKGSVVGFGARTLGDAEPKYLNSPESPVFSKRNLLYGLHAALPELRKARRALMMEGYMDVIAAHQFGFANAVAPLGTAATAEQGKLLKNRSVTEVIVVFDSDASGQSAAFRGAELLMETFPSVRIATVSSGKDPDELLRKAGPEAFQKCLDDAVDIAEFKTGLALKGRKQPLSPLEKSEAAREVYETVALCPDEVLKGEWIRRLSQRLGIAEAGLRLELRKGASPRRALPARREAAAVPAKVSQGDKEILALLFKAPALAKTVTAEDVESAGARRVVARLSEEGADISWREFLEALDPQDRPQVSRILAEDVFYADPEATLAALIEKRRRVARLKELEPRILKMMGSGEPVDEKLKEEYSRLLVELKGSKR